METPQTLVLRCRDDYGLTGHFWPAIGPEIGTVIINPATGVLARYYHRYARFLTEHGFCVLTYDYRGIGLSRPTKMRQARFRWRDWGELDVDAAIAWARSRNRDGFLAVVGHSIGGFLPGFAPMARHVDRILTVGAQFAFWRDYDRDKRLRLVLKWHVAMPVLTALFGYFPGQRLGWLEDLPAGVAREWSVSRARMEMRYPRHERQTILDRFASVRAPILAVGTTDDEYGTPSAIARALGYYQGSERSQVLLTPNDLGLKTIGHFDLFHARHADDFWPMTCDWLRNGTIPWPVHRYTPPFIPN